MTSPPEDVYEAAARAANLAKFTYAPAAYFSPEQRERAISIDALSTSEEAPHRAAVDSAYAAGVAAGRAQAAVDIRAADVERIERLHGDTVRLGLTVAARIAEGKAP